MDRHKQLLAKSRSSHGGVDKTRIYNSYKILKGFTHQSNAFFPFKSRSSLLRYNTTMHLLSLSLQHFRNYTKHTFAFSPKVTLLVGENAKGKTNVLEAIALLSTGESFRADKIEEMVQWGKEVGRVKGLIDSEIELEVVLTTGMVQGERVQKRKYLLDGAGKRKKDLVGHLVTVVFRPEDLDLISGSPSLRRKFFDTVLTQIDREYRDARDAYEKALQRRNALLDVLREGNTTRATFTFWDQLLIKHGNTLTDKRQKFCDFLNARVEFPMEFHITYDPSTISEHRLHQYAVEEVAAGHTLVGPHKDDWFLTLENGQKKELSAYGSRGEQRMGVLWLKIGELDYAEHTLKERPILLLDDIFSELDEDHRDMVEKVVKKQQTIMTATETRGARGEVVMV